MTRFNVALIGNPNCGKSTLFNNLTAGSQKTGNWSGVTVSAKSTEFVYKNTNINIIDLPGVYSLEYPDIHTSKDESITCGFILQKNIDLIINVIDASNLERSLYLTSQLQELDIPMVLALNMLDTCKKQGIDINIKKLTSNVECEVISLNTNNKKNLIEIKDVIIKAQNNKKTSKKITTFDTNIERAIYSIQSHITFPYTIHKRWHAIKLLEGVRSKEKLKIENHAQDLRSKLEANTSTDLETKIAAIRYQEASQIVKKTKTQKDFLSSSVSTLIDKVVLHKIFGIPIFIGAMYIVFFLSMSISKVFDEFFEKISDLFFIQGSSYLLNKINAPDIIVDTISIGVCGGIQVVISFIPVIFLLFIFLSFLENSGYMSRAVLIIDKFMQYLQLPGKAFVPMLIGFGCNVPAVMAARTMENTRDRMLTISMIPFMSCSAKLPVYTLFASLFFPQNGENIIFMLYMIGILAAIFTAFILKNSILGKFTKTPTFIELTNYKVPTIKDIIYNPWIKTKSFVINAGKLIIVITAILHLLNHIETDGSFVRHNTDKSLLSYAGKKITPIFGSLGVQEDNWQATIGIISGFLAKEAIIGTLRNLYSPDNNLDNDDDSSFTDKLIEAIQTIPNNLMGLIVKQKNIDMEVLDNDETFHYNMKKTFPSTTTVIAYLLFVLLYTPCVSVIGVIKKETSSFWAIVITFWNLFLAYAVSTLYYQLSLIATQPFSTLLWVSGINICIIIFMLFIRKYTNKMVEINRNAFST